MEVLTARRLRKVMQRVPRCDTVELSAPGGEGGGQIGVAEIVNHRIIVEPPSPPLVFSRQNHRHRLSPARPAARHYRGIAIAAGILARDYLLSLSRLCARARHRLSHASKLSHAPTPLQRPRLAPNVALSAPALFRDSAHDLPAPKGAALPHTDSRVSSDRLRDAVEQQRPPPA